mgnify:CR=1 FL=1
MKFVMNYKFVFILAYLVVFCSTVGYSQLPELGAQVWIEPGHTDEEIDNWFKILDEQEMPVARLFIMWNYIEHERGEWDFSLYDKAFDAAEKYDVKIVGTLTTNRKPPHRGDLYQLHGHELEGTQSRLKESAIYIQKIVGHWKDHPALDSWMLTNEAAQHPHPQPLAIQRYREWLKNKYNNIETLNDIWFADFESFEKIEYSERWTKRGYWNWQILHMDWFEFWRNHLTWWLNWISDEVRKIDSNTPIHVHSQNITGNLADLSYDFPSWRKIGNSLGTSAHVSWAFGSFERDQFALGMSYVSDLFAGSSEKLPYWITELQGGTNLYSGGDYPMTPSPKDISQWVWTSFGSGADRIIFWMLNNRLKSFETTEWSMLDFNLNPTEGLKVAGEIAQTINENIRFFESADPVRSPITILLSLESMTSELWCRPGDYLGRGRNAHTFSAYGYYEAFSELGVPVQIKFMHDYEWNSDKMGRMAILPHITVISENQQKGMENFVKKGNTLLMSGLSGLMDEKTEAWVYKDFSFSSFLGADFKDYSLIDEVFQFNLQNPALSLPAHLWRGEIENQSAEVIGRYKDKITAVEHTYGEGKAIWIPSLLGLGAWIEDNESLSQLVSHLAESQIAELPFKFSGRQESCVLRILENKGKYVTIVTNGTNESNNCLMDRPATLESEFLWGHENQLVGNAVNLGARETSVILWQ